MRIRSDALRVALSSDANNHPQTASTLQVVDHIMNHVERNNILDVECKRIHLDKYLRGLLKVSNKLTHIQLNELLVYIYKKLIDPYSIPQPSQPPEPPADMSSPQIFDE